MNNTEEIWKEYPLPHKSPNIPYKLFFSNHGRVKSVRGLSEEEKILKGSMRLGYRVISLKFFVERPKNIQKKIDDFNLKLDLLRQEIKELLKINDFPEVVLHSRLFALRKKRDNLIKDRGEYTRKSEKKRTINFHVLVQRAVAELFIRKGKPGEVVIHKDWVKTNNHVDNLEWMTKSAALSRSNARRKEIGYPVSIKRNKKSGASKLIAKDVLYIKEKLSQGKTLKELAKKFGVSDMQIHRIKTGKCWSEVKTVQELNELDTKNKKWQAT